MGMVARGFVCGGGMFAAAFSATVLAVVVVVDAPWVETLVAVAYGRKTDTGYIAADACQDAVRIGFALGVCFGVGLLLCVDLLSCRVEGRWGVDIGVQGAGPGCEGGNGCVLRGGLWKISGKGGHGGPLEGAAGVAGSRGGSGAAKIGGGIKRCVNGRLMRCAENGVVKRRGLSEGWAGRRLSDPDSESEGAWGTDADPFSPSDAASLWEDTESTGDERRPGRHSRREGARRVPVHALEPGAGLDRSCSTSAITDTTDVAGTSEDRGARGGGRCSDSPWSEEGMAGKMRPRDPGGAGGLARLLDDCTDGEELLEAGEGQGEVRPRGAAELMVARRSNSDLVASVRAWEGPQRAKEWRSPARNLLSSIEDIQEEISDAGGGRCCVPWLPPRPPVGDGQPGGALPADLMQSLESIIVGSCDGSQDVGDWSPIAPTEGSRAELQLCFRSRGSVSRRTDLDELWDGSPDRMMMAGYLAGNQSDGGRSAPPQVRSHRSSLFAPGGPSLLEASGGRKGEATGGTPLDSEYIVQRSHKTSHRTILDELELLAEMDREECVYRIERQKNHMDRLRREEARRREAFANLKKGTAPTTYEVDRLRRRWGVKRRAKCRKKLGMMKSESWIDDMPLPLRNGCGLQVNNDVFTY
eukprot:evm.model.scf_3264.3 EVM.evm.TU.scf_3264.3   scf_3264:11650-13949(-)